MEATETDFRRYLSTLLEQGRWLAEWCFGKECAVPEYEVLHEPSEAEPWFAIRVAGRVLSMTFPPTEPPLLILR